MATRRVYVDSRFRHSGSEGDFRVILDTPIELSEGALGYIDGICLSNTFPTLVSGVNNRLYVRQLMSGVGLVRRTLAWHWHRGSTRQAPSPPKSRRS